jgi:hypothetical protein
MLKPPFVRLTVYVRAQKIRNQLSLPLDGAERRRVTHMSYFASHTLHCFPIGPNGIEVFAAGARNPFGIHFASTGLLYVAGTFFGCCLVV